MTPNENSKGSNKTQRILSDLIDSTTIKNYNLSTDKSYSVIEKRAQDLLTPKRIDIVAKYMYLLFEQKKIKSDLAKKVYKKHIEIFSDGRFYEPGSDSKTSFDAFLAEYRDTYASILKNGFDETKSLVPIGTDGTIINGGHRTAIGIYLDKNIPVLEIGKESGLHYDYRYFEKGYMEREYLDFLALNYLRLTQKQTFAICLWPKAVKLGKVNQCEELISKHTNIVYKKQINFQKIGLKNFMMHLYQTENWVGNGSNNFIGAYGKVDLCYSKADTIIYFVEAKNLKTILELKEKIRALYNIEKHSVHITDNSKETMLAANLILTKTGVSALNFGQQNKLNTSLDKLPARKKESDEILNPLYTLSYFGYDVAVSGKTFWNPKDFDKDITYDTTNYFYYRGFKFVAPEYAKTLCDKKYQKLFDSISSIDKVPLRAKLGETLAVSAYRAKRSTRYVLRKTGLLKYVRKVLHK